MLKVVIIGSGNVATHLTNAFLKVDKVKVTQVSSRKLNTLPNAAVYIIAVSDDAIVKVSAKINRKELVVHTSGSVSLHDLQNEGNKGVFYLLQSFSKNKKVDFSEVPFCLETENKEDMVLLEKLAKSIGKNIYHINSKQRKSLHLAAVFVNNFTNHLYKIGNDICTKHQIPFKVLYPLIIETASKIKYLSPKEAQTGPAIRNDQQTIKNHLYLLTKHQQEIYTVLTESIQYEKKL